MNFGDGELVGIVKQQGGNSRKKQRGTGEERLRYKKSAALSMKGPRTDKRFRCSYQ